MKLFGSLKELVAIVFREDSNEVTLRPNQSTTYSASRDIQLPPGDAAHVLVSANSTQTLTNKTIDGDDNTVSDLALTSLKTVADDASKFIVRDGSGIPVSNTKAVPTGDVVGTSDTQTLTGKTIDGDDNTVQDLPLTALKTVAGDASKFLVRDGDGIPVSSKSVPSGDVVGTSDSQTLTSKTLTSPVLNTGVSGTAVDTDGTLAANSDTLLASQKAVKTYVDTEIAGVSGTGDISAKSADYTVTDTDGIGTIVMTCGGTDRTVTLPTASANTNRILHITKTDDLDTDGTGKLTIDGEGDETVDGAANLILFNKGDRVSLQCDGTAWVILSIVQTEFLCNSGDDDNVGNADDTTSFYYSRGGVGCPKGSFDGSKRRRIRALESITDKHTLTLEVDPANQDQWQTWSYTVYSGSVYADNYHLQTNSGVGRPLYVSGTDIDVTLGRYAADSLIDWAAGHNTIKWRVKKQRLA